MSPPRILISGAGIAGLGLSRRLHQLGIAHRIIEKRSAHQPDHAGIALPFNAVQALRRLGLAEAVLAVAHPVSAVSYTRKDGRLLGSANLNEAPLNQDRFVALRRSELHRILLDGLESSIRFQTTIEQWRQTEHGIEVNSSDPTIDGHYDLLVDAEGLHSPLRQQAYPGQQTLVDHDVTTWRFLVELPGHGLQPRYMFGRSEMFMAYPIGPDSLYCYAHVYDADRRFAAQDARHSLRQLFGGFADPVGPILARLDQQTILTGRLQSVPHAYYRQGHIAFIGDAGNGCSPLLQQGAACALEDGLCLAEQLSRQPVAAALRDYQAIRAPRVDWIVAASDGPLKMIKRMRSPLGALMRNLLIRKKGPLNAVGWRELARR